MAFGTFTITTLVILATLVSDTALRAAVYTSELIANLPPVNGTAFSSSPGPGVEMGGFFYFAASDGNPGAAGRELWRTDSTVGGTTLVKDIRPGSEDSSPTFLTVAGSRLFFMADSQGNGPELWKSDGTAAGTVRVADLGGNRILEMQAAGNAVYFSTTGSGFYKSDGTTVGTVRLAGFGGIITSDDLYVDSEQLGITSSFAIE